MTKEGFKKFAKIALPEAPPDADVEVKNSLCSSNTLISISFELWMRIKMAPLLSKNF